MIILTEQRWLWRSSTLRALYFPSPIFHFIEYHYRSQDCHWKACYQQGLCWLCSLWSLQHQEALYWKYWCCCRRCWYRQGCQEHHFHSSVGFFEILIFLHLALWRTTTKLVWRRLLWAWRWCVMLSLSMPLSMPLPRSTTPVLSTPYFLCFLCNS